MSLVAAARLGTLYIFTTMPRSQPRRGGTTLGSTDPANARLRAAQAWSDASPMQPTPNTPGSTGSNGGFHGGFHGGFPRLLREYNAAPPLRVHTPKIQLLVVNVIRTTANPILMQDKKPRLEVVREGR